MQEDLAGFVHGATGTCKNLDLRDITGSHMGTLGHLQKNVIMLLRQIVRNPAKDLNQLNRALPLDIRRT